MSTDEIPWWASGASLRKQRFNHMASDVNKDLGLKAKDSDPKANAKDLSHKAKD